MRWYSENIATDFYSEYHRYRPDRPYDWDLSAGERAAEERIPRAWSRSSGIRVSRIPSGGKIHDRLVADAKRNAPYRPLFYSLGDESGIADLAAFWDFDFSDQSLVPMRRWLRERYRTLAALNHQWGTNYTTLGSGYSADNSRGDEAHGRAISPHGRTSKNGWISPSRMLSKWATNAIREVDPDAYVGSRRRPDARLGRVRLLADTQALTAIEPYDIGNNIEIIRSLNPDMAVVTTGFANGPWEKHRVWYELLHGNRGLIIWDDKARVRRARRPTGTARPRGGALLQRTARRSRRAADQQPA